MDYERGSGGLRVVTRRRGVQDWLRGRPRLTTLRRRFSAAELPGPRISLTANIVMTKMNLCGASTAIKDKVIGYDSPKTTLATFEREDSPCEGDFPVEIAAVYGAWLRSALRTQYSFQWSAFPRPQDDTRSISLAEHQWEIGTVCTRRISTHRNVRNVSEIRAILGWRT